MCSLSTNKLVIGMITTAREQHVYHSVLSHFEYDNLKSLATHTLKKQVGSFNHRVVTTVADKLKRLWL